MTGNDLIASALRLIGVLASGETPTAAEASDALVILNQMIDAWGAESLMLFTLTRQIFALQAAKQNYTFGTNGDFNAARPPRIDYASIISLANPAQPLELPIPIYTDAQWQSIPVKNISGSLPNGVYDDGGFPLRTLSFWPIPNIVVNAALGCWTALSQFTLAADYTFPPGYLEAIRYNLAPRLAPEFGAQTPPEVAILAQESKARIKSVNITPIDLKCDAAVVGSGAGTGWYNWLTDNAGPTG